MTKPESLIKAAMMIKRNCNAHEKQDDACKDCPFRGKRIIGAHAYPSCVLNDTFAAVWEIEEGSEEHERK